MAEASTTTGNASIFGDAPPVSLSHFPESMSTGTGGPAGYREIASSGDVILKIPAAAGTTKLRVSSHVLCTTSPVFRAMLGSHSQFKEASELRTRSAGDPYELSIVDDYPYALTAILLALHCRSEMVPVNPAFKDLVELAIVCDKYDCRGGLLPWVDTWTAVWKPLMLESGYEEWLFVAWVFGIKEGFDELSRRVILESYIDPADGTLRCPGEVRLGELTIPEGILDFITAERASTIARIIRKMEDMATEYASTRERAAFCKGEPPSKECDALVLGSVMQNFQSSETPKEFKDLSVLGLRDVISGLQLRFLPKFKCWSTACQKPPASYSALAKPCRCGGRFRVKGSHSETCDPLPKLLVYLDSIISSVSVMDLEALKRIPMKGPEWQELDIREPVANTPKVGKGKKRQRMSESRTS